MKIFTQLENYNSSIFLKKENIFSLVLILSVFFFDRITKNFIINDQFNNKNIYINDYINFDLVWNTGIGFGLLSSNSNLIYNLISSIIGLVIIFLIYLII